MRIPSRMFKQATISRKRILQHVAFWTAMVIMFTVNYVFAPGVAQRRFTDTFVFLPAHLVFAYTQMYYAIPQLLLKRRYRRYVMITFFILVLCIAYSHFVQIMVLGGSLGRYYWERYFHYKNFVVRFGRSAFALFFTSGLAVAIKLFKEWFRQREQTLQAENEKVKMELESLRSQIHPHFLFNTLNNLYSLTLTNSASASLVVEHLSDLLRYMLYECREQYVSVNKELNMLKKYIELEKLRYGNRLDVAFNITGDTSGLVVSPLLFLPFVENSFKHGVSQQLDQCWINIHIYIEDNTMTFQVSNSRTERHEHAYGGLGMQNVQKRLQLLYPDTHKLKITEEDEVYVVRLELSLIRLTEEYPPEPTMIKKFSPTLT